MNFTPQFSAGQQVSNIAISKIQPDYCQKLNTNFQDNPCAID